MAGHRRLRWRDVGGDFVFELLLDDVLRCVLLEWKWQRCHGLAPKQA